MIITITTLFVERIIIKDPSTLPSLGNVAYKLDYLSYFQAPRRGEKEECRHRSRRREEDIVCPLCCAFISLFDGHGVAVIFWYVAN